jgi:glycosyltransferase involved in cell wall biosynthesis
LDRRLRVLVVSHSFPPLAEVGVIRVTQLCRYLPDWGIEPIVLSGRERSYDARDYSRKLPPGLRVLRATTMSTPLDWYAAARKRRNRREIAHQPPAPEPNSANDGVLRRNFKALLQFPDRYWGWYLSSVRLGTHLLREEKIDAIYSSGPPWTSHLVARHLKRKFGLPWIIDFRDPWASSLPEETNPAWWHDWAKRLEESCVRRSDLVLGNTDHLTAALRHHYADLDTAKFRTLTNGFEDLVVPPPRKPGSRRLLLHLGSLYGNRRVDTFLIALAELVNSGRLAPQSFEVLFQGENDPPYLAEAARLVPQLMENGCVRFSPPIAWEEASKLLWGTDLLLLFQGSHALQVPAKFYEYLQTGVPILAVSETGALTELMDETQAGIWVRPGDTQEIASKLLQAFEWPSRNPEDVRKLFAGRYHYRNLARELGRWIEELCQPQG